MKLLACIIKYLKSFSNFCMQSKQQQKLFCHLNNSYLTSLQATAVERLPTLPFTISLRSISARRKSFGSNPLLVKCLGSSWHRKQAVSVKMLRRRTLSRHQCSLTVVWQALYRHRYDAMSYRSCEPKSRYNLFFGVCDY